MSSEALAAFCHGSGLAKQALLGVPAVDVLAAAPPLQQARPEIDCKHFIYGYSFGTLAADDPIIREVLALSAARDDGKLAADYIDRACRTTTQVWPRS